MTGNNLKRDRMIERRSEKKITVRETTRYHADLIRCCSDISKDQKVGLAAGSACRAPVSSDAYV